MQVFLNGKFVAKENAVISPMDRGFLFGDGIYEVIPCYDSKPVGLALHLNRMNNGLKEIGIGLVADTKEWLRIIETIIAQFDSTSVGVYIHVSRGTDTKRHHAYPENVTPTVFAYGFDIPPSQTVDRNTAKAFEVITGKDLRWQRCHIKSTSLLGNVMHFQQGQNAQKDEIILFNDKHLITEAAACNVFVIKGNVIMTPKLDNQLLPGITRNILLQSLALQGGFTVYEQDISLEQLGSADEVWITSSSKEVGAVVKVDDRVLGNGKPGPVWEAAQNAYNRFKYTL
ncbi:MAG: D-alanine transaminase [Alphaproteobacteria bacterium]|jgi:D-alanine transaminase